MKRTLFIFGVLAIILLGGFAVWYFFFAAEETPQEGDGGTPFLPSYSGDSVNIPSEPNTSTAAEPKQSESTSVTGTKFTDWFFSGTPSDGTVQDEPKQETHVSFKTAEAKKAEVRTDFTRQMGTNPDGILPYDTTIVSNYALQSWADENMGGVALLKYSTTSGWVIVKMGGGAPSINWLLSLGVPYVTAYALMADSGYDRL